MFLLGGRRGGIRLTEQPTHVRRNLDDKPISTTQIPRRFLGCCTSHDPKGKAPEPRWTWFQCLAWARTKQRWHSTAHTEYLARIEVGGEGGAFALGWLGWPKFLTPMPPPPSPLATIAREKNLRRSTCVPRTMVPSPNPSNDSNTAWSLDNQACQGSRRSMTFGLPGQGSEPTPRKGPYGSGTGFLGTWREYCLHF